MPLEVSAEEKRKMCFGGLFLSVLISCREGSQYTSWVWGEGGREGGGGEVRCEGGREGGGGEVKCEGWVEREMMEDLSP